MTSHAQKGRIDAAVMAGDNRAASPEAIALWLAAGKMQDVGPQGIDAGLLLVVRDKIDAMLAADLVEGEAA